MQKFLKELVVFMASPSDLNDERQVIRTIEDELNHLFSRYGIRVRVVGWELTMPGYGRAPRTDKSIGARVRRIHWTSQ